MVYLNPSHAGSRRSSSVRSNQSASRSTDRNDQGKSKKSLATGRRKTMSPNERQEISIQQAYHQEGRQTKHRRASNNAIQPNSSAALQVSSKRNKSISSRQPQKVHRIFSPPAMQPTTKFDSYESLPKQSEQLFKFSSNNFAQSQFLDPVQMLTASHKGTHSRQGALSGKVTGVSQGGIILHDADALKLSSPWQLSPTIPSKAEQTSRSSVEQLRHNTGHPPQPRKQSTTPKPKALPAQFGQGGSAKIKLKHGGKALTREGVSNAKGGGTSASGGDSFARTHNKSTESTKGAQTSLQAASSFVPTGKTSKLQLVASRGKTSN